MKLNSESTVLGTKWSMNDFAIDQVWAVYHGKDLMPRKYALLNNVITESEVCVTILEPEPIFDFEVCWKEDDLPIACGVFRAREKTANLNIYQIYPI